MTKIKFGTDGWRAIIAKEYTIDNLARVAEATADWVLKNNKKKEIVLGYDCRFGGVMFAEACAKVYCSKGIKVKMSDGFVSTPMISLAAKKLNTGLGIIITASHNPPLYNGYKIKSPFGGPALQSEIDEVEALIPEKAEVPDLNLEDCKKDGLFEYVDLEKMYIDELVGNFDFEMIKKSGLTIAYDAMYGSGQNVIPAVLPDSVLLNCVHNPLFNGVAPEPLAKNLTELSETIKRSGDIDLGLAVDGDADRIALFDNQGKYVDSHHVILLLIHYLVKYKKMTGKVVIAFSVSNKVKKLCEHYGLEYEVTKIGFKHICEIMMKEDTLVGGEESGGIAVKGHIPERDGIWDGIVLLEFMAKTGKTLIDLIDEVYSIVGPFSYERNDLRLKDSEKQSIIDFCKNDKYQAFGEYKVEKIEKTDGFKFYLGNDRTIMIRPSGTEPVLRVYAEGKDAEEVQKMLKAVKATILD
ncbi:MAG: phosphoglucomutase/phosphomannomutase family protein [Chitinophagaceae bacterium]|nr:MAG: phosphoglucomutase/phosphomannomutase family protein [Chitinophagaceae bacterium]